MRLLGLFDPRGRLSRRAYTRLILRATPLAVALLCLAVAAGAQGWRPLGLALFAAVVLPWLASLAWTVRRLHDRGRTGWWVVLALALTALSFVPVEKAADAHPVPVILYALATLAASLWLIVETLGRRGTPGPNRYGPAPVE